MCGIVAIWSPGRPVSRAVIQKATDVLHHRGPDGSGLWISPDGRVGLGHARLSIIDLTTGDQPIANEDEQLQIVVNGEFYGYQAIRERLARAGHRLRTRSDSEIVLHLYEGKGTQCVHDLRGEFAFVLWDGRTNTLVAVRDRFGIKPLFWAVHEGALILASEVKALFAAGVPARWNWWDVYHGWWGAPEHSSTLFEGVRQIPPGYFLTATGATVELHQYWDFDYPPAPDTAQTRPDGEYIEEFRRTLQDAVRLRLRADVPVGCYLSGGLDSSAILGLASAASSRPIRAFTLTFDHAAYDESAIACEMALHANAEYCPIQDSTARSGRQLFRCRLSRRAAFRKRAHRREVHLEPCGPGCRLQGRDDGRRVRRNSRGIRLLPSRYASARQWRSGSSDHPPVHRGTRPDQCHLAWDHDARCRRAGSRGRAPAVGVRAYGSRGRSQEGRRTRVAPY